MRRAGWVFLVCGCVAACGDTASIGSAQQAAAEFRILSPSPDGASNGARPLVRWEPSGPAHRYRVTLFTDAALENPVEVQVVRTTEVLCETALAEGQVAYVAVDALDGSGLTLSREVSRFRVILPPNRLPRFEVERTRPEREQEGFRLFNLVDREDDPALRAGFFILVNRAGEILWWFEKPQGVLEDVRVLAHGNLLYNFRDESAAVIATYGVEMTWDGVEVWRSRAGVLPHHEVMPGPGGNYLYLKWVFEEVDGEMWEGDGLEIVDPATNQVLWEWSIFDHISTDLVDPLDIARTGLSGRGLDWTHSNAAVWDPDRSLIWVSVRSLDRIIAIDYPSGDIRETFGKGGLGGAALMSHQHAPQVLEDGSILFYDNGNRRDVPVSRVVAFFWDEALGTVSTTFEWIGEPPFFDFALGDADRLPNGNTLVVSGVHSRILEIDAAGEMVWDLRSSSDRYWIYRAESVPRDRIPPGVLPFD